MTCCIYCNSFAADFSIANYTVNNVIVFTVVFTIGSNLIFHNSCACCMTKYTIKLCTAYCTCLCCCTCCIGTSLMAKCGNCFLSNENLITYGTVLTFCQACFSTCRIYRFVDYFCMTCRIYCNSFAADFNIANCTVNYVIVSTVIFTIGINLIFYNNIACCMTKCGLELCTTYCTCLCCCTCCVDTCLMAKCVNCFLSNENFVTCGTMLTFCQAGCSTCGCYCYIDYFCMAKLFCKLNATYCTCLCSCTRCIGTSLMTKCGNCFLSNENFVTCGTVLAFCQTGCSTCGSYCRINHFCMTECIHLVCHIGITTITSVRCVTTFSTCRISYYAIICVFVFINYYRSDSFLTVCIVSNYNLCCTIACKCQSTLCPIGCVRSINCRNCTIFSCRRNEYLKSICIDRNAIKLLEELTNCNCCAFLIVDTIYNGNKLIDRVSLFSVENCNSVKCKLAIVSKADCLYTPTVALDELVEGQVNYLLIFLENRYTVYYFCSCISMLMFNKNSVTAYDMITLAVKQEVTRLCPSLTVIDLIK